MLVVEDLNLERWLRRGPLIYPILFESLLLSVLFIGFHVLEHLVKGIIKGETLGASLPSIGGGGLAGVVCVALILFVSLIPFFAFRTISRELGPSYAPIWSYLFQSPRPNEATDQVLRLMYCRHALGLLPFTQGSTAIERCQLSRLLTKCHITNNHC